MKTYLFTITGMDCHSCASLITMDLEEAKLPAPESLSFKDGKMKIKLEEDQVDAVRAVVEKSGKYAVESTEVI
ncbi:MAG: hypothetical protein ABIG66_05080 [Candidatus Kerfeldbacteria bacterium]